MQTQVNTLLQKQMDRKEFLKHVAMGVAVITGVAGVMKFFGKQESSSTVAQASTNGSYGVSTYGGQRARV